MNPARRDLRRALTDIETFSHTILPAVAMRPYQLEPARAIVESVERGLGRQFAVVFSRQAGKDETLAQVLAFLLSRYRLKGGSAVLAAPTFIPQAALSRDRLLARLDNSLTTGKIRVHDGYAVTLGRASARFLSAAPGANARGQTADLLLVANEAQDIQPAVWDAVFDPMAASTNATTVFLGTVWSRDTLLARQMRHLAALEAADGIQRVWRVPWERVAADVPAYGERVRQRIAQFGIDHPFIRTEYCLHELEGEGGLFPPERLAAMRGDHPRQHEATPGKRYALLIDVAGEEERGRRTLSSFRPAPVGGVRLVVEVAEETIVDGMQLRPGPGPSVVVIGHPPHDVEVGLDIVLPGLPLLDRFLPDAQGRVDRLGVLRLEEAAAVADEHFRGAVDFDCGAQDDQVGGQVLA